MSFTKHQIAQMIDHTILKATARSSDILKLCEEAEQNNFYSVCVNPFYASLAAEKLQNSKVKVCVVVGFPLGASCVETKAQEAKKAVRDGAEEIDMVINIGALKDGNYELVENDIHMVAQACKPAKLKVILETCYLSENEIIKACKVAASAGADFVKTSTGFGDYGAKEDHVKLMRKTVGEEFGVKASGGISSSEDALKMIKAGATRLGASKGIKIISGFEK
ncbi:MAG: deoxyribose-phosphate aldolase [Myxococcota bacterium]